MSFEIKQIQPKIFLFQFDNRYSMCMNFLRYQEYYESFMPEFKGKAFTIIDFMEAYAKETQSKDQFFSYPIDWNGFNIPSKVIPEVIYLKIPDKNKYDKAMLKAYKKCLKIAQTDKFYIIGALSDDDQTLDHELAHGMYYLNDEYKSKVKELIMSAEHNIIEDMEKQLSDIGYIPEVMDDEINAYFSAFRQPKEFGIDDIHKIPFKNLFDEYKGK